jgi:hypothetical protein
MRSGNGSGRRLWPSFMALSAQVLNFNTCWTWFNDPRAYYDPGTQKAYIAGIQSDGRLRITVLDFASNLLLPIGRPYGTTVLEADDHNNPAIIVLDNGKLLTAFSQHNGNSYSVRSTNAHDASTWDSPVTLATGGTLDSYAHLMQMGDTAQTVFWFFRRGSTDPKPIYYRTSTDRGSTWSSATELVNAASTTHCYFKCVKTSGSRIDVVVASGHPDETGAGSLYHGYIVVASNGTLTFFQTDGTSVTSPPFAPSEFSLMYDGSSTNPDGWQYDIDNIGGTPTITYVVLESTNTVHRYYQARWSGSAWQSDEVCTGGTTGTTDSLDPTSSVQYSGGIALDPNDLNTVYASREYGAGDFRIEKWTHTGTFPSGTWAKAADTSGSTGTKNARPYCLRGLSPTRVLWWEGTYTSYVSYATRLRMAPAFSWRAGKAAAPTLSSGMHSGVQSYFLIREGSGTSLTDLVNARNGTFVGTPTWQTSGHALAPYLNGWSTSNYVQINAVGTACNFTSYPWWWALLFRNSNSATGAYPWSVGNSTDTTPYGAGIFNSGSANNGGSYLRDNSGNVLFAAATDSRMSDGELHVLMGARSAVNRMDTYLDGVLLVSDSGVSLGTVTVNRGAIGCLVRDVPLLATAADIFCFVIGHGSAPDPEYLALDLLQGQFIGTFAPVSAALTGTAVGGITEADLVTGNKTVIITLSGTTFIP